MAKKHTHTQHVCANIMANTPMTEQNEERQQLHSGAKHVNCAYNIKWADKKLNIPFNAHKLIINAYKADNHITHLISILLKINNYYEILLTYYIYVVLQPEENVRGNYQFGHKAIPMLSLFCLAAIQMA